MKRTILGSDKIDRLINELKGMRCGLLTAASGVDSFGVSTYLKLSEKGMLTVLFSPEHGIHSVLQDGAWGGEYVDRETGVPVYDINSKGNEKIDSALSKCDVLIYDIQDVGARFYTYIYCLTYLMQRCAERNIPVFVLDRPNPISGALNKISGPVLDETRFSSSVGRYAVPTRYSLTCGEFANYINDVKHYNCDLNIVCCENWDRSLYWDQCNNIWINPSPNIPTIDSAINYIGTCLVEATNASEGRGTTRPFDIVGAPYVDSVKMCAELNNAGIGGIIFTRAFFTPMFGKWHGEACEGVQLNITDRNAYDPHLAGLHIINSLRKFEGFSCREESMCLRYGNDALISESGFDPDEIYQSEKEKILKYQDSIKNYLIYD